MSNLNRIAKYQTSKIETDATLLNLTETAEPLTEPTATKPQYPEIYPAPPVTSGTPCPSSSQFSLAPSNPNRITECRTKQTATTTAHPKIPKSNLSPQNLKETAELLTEPNQPKPQPHPNIPKSNLAPPNLTRTTARLTKA